MRSSTFFKVAIAALQVGVVTANVLPARDNGTTNVQLCLESNASCDADQACTTVPTSILPGVGVSILRRPTRTCRRSESLQWLMHDDIPGLRRPRHQRPRPGQPPLALHDGQPVQLVDPAAVVPSVPMRERAADEPYSAPGVARASGGSGDANEASQSLPPQHTFRSLYEMLADERSARRKLETQMRGLSEEIANLHQQVAIQSSVQSQRSSYGGGLMMGSTRLQALLRETETSPPGTADAQQQRPQQRDSGATQNPE